MFISKKNYIKNLALEYKRGRRNLETYGYVVTFPGEPEPSLSSIHELALLMNEIVDLKRQSKYFRSAAYGKITGENLAKLFPKKYSYCVMHVDTVSLKREPVSSDETLETAISQMNIFNATCSRKTIYYTIEVF